MKTRDTLLQYLVGINEEESIRVINTQMAKLVNKLGAMRVKIEIDPNTAKQMASQVSEIVKSIDLRKNYIKPNNLFPTIDGEHNEAIREAMQTYRDFGFTLDRITKDAKGNLISFTGKAKDANGALKTLRFNAEGKITGETLILNTEKQITSMLEKAKTAERALATLQTRIVQSGGKPSQLSREAELLKQIDGLYAAAAVEVQNSDRVTEDYRQTLLNNIAIQKQAGETVLNIARQRAQADRVEADSFKEKENALKEYAAVLKRLNGIQLGENTGYFEEDLVKSKLELEELIGTTSEYKVKLSEAREAAKEAFRVEELKQARDQYDKIGLTIESLGEKLKRAQINLDKAKLKDNQQDILAYQMSIEEITKEMEGLGLEAQELAKKLRLEDTEEVLNTVNNFKNLRAELEQTANTSEILDSTFGKVVETFRDGTAIGNVTESTKELTVGVEELGRKLLGQSATVRKVDKDNTNFNQMTKKVTYSVKEADGQFKLYTYTLDKASNSLRLTGIQTDTAAKKIVGFKNQITDAAKKIATWGLSTKLVYGTWQAFGAGIEVVKELDKELTQIAIVQGVARSSTKELGAEYAETAVKMAQTVQDVAKLNTELIRQGLSLEESAQRTDVIMKLSAAGMVTMEQALQTITTGVNALGVTQERVADVILKASMLSASDVEGLGEAFSKTASGAKAAGLSIEETSAMLAVMKDVTQEGDSQLGTSLKSMLARFNKINEETGDLNEELNEVQKAIESVGVNFTDSEGQIRSFYDIVQDLSVGWNDLDKNTKSYIATQAAGVRQQNRFFALMDNFNKVQAINNDLVYAAGTLQESYATYLDSSEASAKRLEASMQQLWINFIDSDVVKGITDLGARIVNLVDDIGVLRTAITTLLVKTLLFNKAFKSVTSTVFADSLRSSAVAMGKLSVETAASTTGLGAFTLMAKGSIGTLGVLKASAIATSKALIAIFPYAAAVAAGIAVFSGLLAIITKVKEESKQAKEEIRGIEAAAKEVLQTENTKAVELQIDFEALDDYRSRINELTSQELQEYYALNQKLIEQYPTLDTQYDQYGNKIIALGTSLDDFTAAQEAAKKAKFDDYLDNIVEITDQKRIDLLKADDINESITAYEAGLRKIERLEKTTLLTPEAKAREIEKATQEMLTHIEGAKKEYAIFGTEVINDYIIKARAAGKELPLALIQALNSEEVRADVGRLFRDDLSFEDALKQSTVAQDMLKDFNNLEVAVDGVKYKVSSFDSVLLKVNQSYKDGEIGLEEYIAQLSSMNVGIGNLAEGNAELAQVLRGQVGFYLDQALAQQEVLKTEEGLADFRRANFEQATEDYNNATKATQGYYDALEQLNNAKISDIEIQNLILEKHPEFIGLMGDRVALTKAVEQAMLDEEQVRLETYMNMLLNTNEFLTSSSSGYSEYISALGTYYTNDITNYAELEKSKAVFTQNLIADLVKAWGRYFNAVDGSLTFNRKAMEADLRSKAQSGYITFGQMSQMLNQVDKDFANAKANLDRVNTSFDNLVDGVKITLPSVKDINKAMDKTASSGKKAAKGVDAAKKALEEYNKAMKATQDATKEVFDFALEYINWIEEQKREEIEKTKDAAIEAAEAAYDTEIELIDKALEQQEEILDAKEATLKTEEEAYEYQKKRLELQDSLVNLEYKLALASLDTSVSGAARRKTLMESLAEEQENLDELEKDRKQTLQEEWFARQRAFIQNQAEIERAQAEATKTAKIEKAEQEYAQKNLKLDQYYSAELNYLAAVEATQSGMIENLNGKMIPLKEAFKELAIENERFWTFFGQQEVEEFGNTVTTVMKAIKKLGFETIQTWKEVAVAATNASNAASAASGSSSRASSPAPSPAPAAAPPPSQVSQSALNKQYQQWLKNLFTSLKLTLPSGFSVDGIVGPATRSASTVAQNRKETNSAVDNVLRSVAQGNKVTGSMMETLRKNATSTASGNTIRAYAQGGKIDYTGPAQVHGSKSKPEYVFNYQQFKDLSKMIARHELTSVKKPTAVTKPVEIKFDNLIKVEGSIDKDSLPRVKQVANDAIDKLANQLKGWGK